jgi:hypothetical protein
VVDDDVAEFFGEGGAPLLRAPEIVITELDVKNVGYQCPAGSHGEGLVVHFAAEPAGDLNGLNLGFGTGGEDTADGLFNAAFDLVQQTHGSSPFPPVPGQSLFLTSTCSALQRITAWPPKAVTPVSDTTGQLCE